MTIAYVALGILGVALIAYLLVRIATRFAREAGASEAKVVASEKVAEDARKAAEVRDSTSSASADERRERLRRWERR